MSQETQNDIAKATVTYEMAGMNSVEVVRGLEYSPGEDPPLEMDLYLPPADQRATPCPVVVLVAGFPDPGYEAALGCRFKETGSTVSWARLLAASGLAAIAYSNREPAAHLDRLLAHLRASGGNLGVDADRIGLWASSANAPTALSVLMRPATVACAALCYPYTLDLEGSSHVANAAAQWRFATPCAGRDIEELSTDVPIFLARAGGDEMLGLNAALDQLATAALGADLPLTLVNLPGAPHAFDLHENSKRVDDIVRGILTFFGSHLRR